MMARSSRRVFATVWAITVVAGCNDARPQQAVPAPETPAATEYDAGNTGLIHGYVRWAGPIPEPPPFEIHTNGYPGKDALRGMKRARPNVPQVDRASGGIAQAVIF